MQFLMEAEPEQEYNEMVEEEKRKKLLGQEWAETREKIIIKWWESFDWMIKSFHDFPKIPAPMFGELVEGLCYSLQKTNKETKQQQQLQKGSKTRDEACYHTVSSAQLNLTKDRQERTRYL